MVEAPTVTGFTADDTGTGVVAGPSYGHLVTAVDLDPSRWGALGGVFADLESAGADTIWLADHLFSGYPGGEPLILAATAIAATSRCRIGTGVLQLPLRSGAAVAKAATTLQLLAGGRFCLGVGAGQHEAEFARAGVDHANRAVTMDRMLAELFDHWRAGDGWFAMRPSAPVPVWLGGRSRAALRRTARYGSGWLALFLSPERFTAVNRDLDRELEAVGRETSAVERRIVLIVTPTDEGWTRDDALAFMARQFPAGSAGVDRYVVTGSVARCAEAVREFEAAGADGVDLQIPHPDPVERFAMLHSALRAD